MLPPKGVHGTQVLEKHYAIQIANSLFLLSAEDIWWTLN